VASAARSRKLYICAIKGERKEREKSLVRKSNLMVMASDVRDGMGIDKRRAMIVMKKGRRNNSSLLGLPD
jgi:hypothetical protein